MSVKLHINKLTKELKKRSLSVLLGKLMLWVYKIVMLASSWISKGWVCLGDDFYLEVRSYIL